MEALVLGRPTADRDDVVRRLRSAGEVHACRDESWGCSELVDGCPLDHVDVDVAVVVADQLGRVDADGLACAHRARVPVLAVGDHLDERVAEHVTRRAAATDDLAAAALATASDVTGHVRAVERELAGHLRSGESVSVRAERRPRTIVVTLTADLDERRAGALADRARAAVRRHDGRVAIIDVKVEPDP